MSHDVDLHGDRIEVECVFNLNGEKHSVHAIHPWKQGTTGDEIKVDGKDVEEDDVDLPLVFVNTTF